MNPIPETLQARPRISVTITRDSVCAGDDCDAPHQKLLEVDTWVDPVAFTRAVSDGYLASVAGVGHTWTCLMNNTPIAEIAHSGIRPLVRATPFSDVNRVHFVYHSATY